MGLPSLDIQVKYMQQPEHPMPIKLRKSARRPKIEEKKYISRTSEQNQSI